MFKLNLQYFGADLSSLDAVLKNQYTTPVQEQLNNETVLFKRIKKRYDLTQGKNFIIPLHVGRNAGIGARGENATLPNAGQQGYKEAIVPMKYNYGRIELSGPTIKAARNEAGAFVRAVSSEVQGMTTDMKKDMNRQYFGEASGKLAVTDAVAGSATVGVDTVMYLQEGMVVDLHAANGTAKTAGLVINSIDEAANNITLSAAVTTTATDILVREGSYGKELSGLGAIVQDSGSLQNIDPSAAGNSYWKSYVNDNGGTLRAVSEDLLRLTKDKVRIKGGNVSLLLSNLGVQAAYVKLLQADRRFISPMELEGGFKALDFDGQPWTTDIDCPKGKVLFLDEKHIVVPRMSDFEWMEEDGAILNRVSGKDAYEATMFVYQEMGTSRRNAHGALEDITEPTGY